MKRFSLILIFFSLTTTGYCASFTATTTGNWSNPATWGGGGFPHAGDNATISSAVTVTVDVASNCTNLTISAGAVTQNANLTVSGIYNQSAGTFTAASPGTVTFSANDFRIPSSTNTLYFNRFTGSGGSGTPYVIYDVYGLQAMGELTSLNRYFILANNIDASGTVNWNSGNGFVSVGRSSSFNGNFNGEGYTISQLAINLGGTNYVGLFASTSSTTISNLNLTVDNIAGSFYVGGLVGYLGGGSISFCTVTVNSSKTVSGTGNVSGFVGWNAGGTIYNSYVTISGTVSGTGNYVGGFAGENSGGGIIYDSYATGTVAGTGTDVGGFAGYNFNSTISNSYATASVAGTSTVNGFVGLDSGGTYNNDWYYNGTAYTQPANVTQATGYSDFYATGSGTGGAVYLVSGNCPAWNFPGNWTSQVGAYPVLTLFTTWDIWQGPSGGNWSTAGNWSGGVPTATTNVLFNATDNNNSTIDASFAGTVANLTINGYTGTITQSHSLAITGAYIQISGTFTCATPATYTFTASEGFSIPTSTNTLFFKRFTGSGGSGAPYFIYDVYGLQAMGELTFVGDYFALANNIDASGTAYWNSGNGFVPVGSSSTFTGGFNGEGYTISHLFIYLPSTNNVGLFASASSATISNLNLTVDNITGSSDVGGLAGFFNSGSISFCTVTVNSGKTVSGTGTYLGGFVGYNSGGTISNSNATISGTVSGSGTYVGGFVGENGSSGIIYDSYATGTVAGTGTDVGGFAGYNFNSTISNSYATVSVAGSSAVNGFVGLNSGGTYNNDWYYNGTAYAQPANVTQATGYSDFYATGSGTGGAVYLVSGTCPAWNFPGNWTSQAGAYPILTLFTTWDIWQGPSGGLWSNAANWSTGVPTSTTNVLFNSSDNNNSTIDAGFISSINNLTINGYSGTITQSANLTITGAYTQTSGTFTCATPATYTFTASEGFSIPTSTNTLFFRRFTGSGGSGAPYFIYDVYGLQAMGELTFVGDYFALANNIDASGTVNWNSGNGFIPVGNQTTGAFSGGGFNGQGYTISHLSINFTGSQYVGLFGYSSGTTISNLNLTVDNITGTGASYVGGLAGYFNSGSISFCTVTVNSGKTVSGTSNYVGGLVGYNTAGTISNSYVTISGTVSGSGTYVGGFVGENGSSGIIYDSYATGTVAGTGTDVGGFAGYNFNSTISNSYATVSVAGSSAVNGFVGLNSGGTYNNDWYYNGTAYAQPANVTQAMGYSDFYATGSGTGGAVYLVSGTCPAWNFPGNWTSQVGAYPILSLFTTWDIWQGPSGGLWSNAANWSTGLPTATTNVLFNSSDNNNSTLDASFAGTIANLTINGYTGTITQSHSLTINGAYTQTSGTFTCATPATYTFTASQGFSIPTTSGTLYFNRFTGGGSPYVVYDLYGLQAMEEELNNSFILANNIDASVTARWSSTSGFLPIGKSFPSFGGSFNGQGYTISHLSINLPTTNYVGLFGYTSSSNTISNLTLTVDNITGSSYVGGLAGQVNSNTISNCSVTVNAGKTISGSSYVGGLAAYFNNGTISNSNTTISGTLSGTSYVGGFIGYDQGGTISNTYATIPGTVSGTGTYVGGFVGYNGNSSLVFDSYATGTVAGTGTDVGGFVGSNNSSTISNSYATVSVAGSSAVNGFVGLNTSGTYNNDWYYNGTAYTQPANVTQATGYSDFYATGSGTGGAVYLVSGTCPAWNFPGNWTSQVGAYPILSIFTPWDIWQGPSGGLWSNAANWSTGLPTATTNVLFNSSDNNNSTLDASFAGTIANLTVNGYTGIITQSNSLTINGAYLQTSGTFTCATPATYTFTASQGFSIPTTSGTLYFNRYTGAGSPYVVYDLYGLQAMDEALNSTFALANNIDASPTASWSSTSGFLPIGKSFPAFNGSFNGQGYTISHLSINLPTTNYVGLIGYTNGSSISNLTLTVDNITGSSYVGGLAGQLNSTTVSNCSVTVNAGKTVSGSSYVGGIAGYFNGGTISNTNTTISGTVSGTSYVGGFIGYDQAGTISNTYANIPGTVSGTGTYVGGFVGYNGNSSLVSDSYATGTVAGTGTDVGGFAGSNNSSTISNSYATVSVAGTSAVNGFVGLNTSGTYNNDWYYNGTAYAQPANVTQATGYSDFYATGSGTGGAVYLVSGTCPAWNFPGNWTSQVGTYPILSIFTTWDIWQGPSGGLWSNAANWSTGLPTATTNVLFNATDNNNSTLDASFAGTIANLTVNGYTGIITQSNSLTINGAYLQTSGTFTCATPATYTFTASQGFSIPTTSGTLYFNRFTGGGSPYVVYDVYGLQAMEEALNSSYVLAENINASVTASWSSTSGFLPVGKSFPSFGGSFNGKGYTISHLSINLPTTNYVGLFGYAATGGNSISNVILTVDNITGSQYVGGLAGELSSGTISGCSVTVNSGKTVSGTNYVGGFAGYDIVNISNSYVTISGTVSGTGSYLGGFVGYNQGSTISNSYATIPGTVSGTGTYVGGFVGYNGNSGTISDSYATGTVAGTGTDVGGFAGSNNSSTISNSFATVSVAGSSAVNGFVGLNSSGTYNNDWYYNGTAYGQPANVTQATGYSDFYATGSGTGGAAFLVSGGCPAWNFTTNWASQVGAYPILRTQLANQNFFAFF